MYRHDLYKSVQILFHDRITLQSAPEIIFTNSTNIFVIFFLYLISLLLRGMTITRILIRLLILWRSRSPWWPLARREGARSRLSRRWPMSLSRSPLAVVLLELHGVLGVVLRRLLHVGVVLLLVRCVPRRVHGRGPSASKLGWTALRTEVSPLKPSRTLNKDGGLRKFQF